MEEIFGLITKYWGVVTSVIALASAYSMTTKSDVDNKIVSVVNKIADYLALNFFRAKDLRPEEED